MSRALTAGLVALVLAVPLAWAQEEGRVSSELSLFTRLNGVPVRYALADGGASSLASGGAGVACIPVAFRDVLLVAGCSAAVNLCASSTDGGCSATRTDINYGVPLAADTGQRYVVVDRSTSAVLCAVGAGAFNCPVWRMR